MTKNRSTNGREMMRQKSVNEAFQRLRCKVPTNPPDKKLSKCFILTRAIEYIKVLDKVLKYQEGEEKRQLEQLENNRQRSIRDGNDKIIFKDIGSEDEKIRRDDKIAIVDENKIEIVTELSLRDQRVDR